MCKRKVIMTPFSKVVMIPRTKNFSMEVANFGENIYESKRSQSTTCNEVVIQQGYYTKNGCKYDGFKQKPDYTNKKSI